MAAKHIVHCCVCHQEMDINSATDWMKPVTNRYYHIKCYEDWVARKADRSLIANRDDDEWFALLKDYVYKDIKLPMINWAKIQTQWNNFVKTVGTPKGIYFAVIYYYEVLHGDAAAAKGGIGIVKNIYNESAAYWRKLEEKREGTLAGIVEQMKARANRPTVTYNDINRRNAPRIKYKLSEIGDDDDD